MKKFERFYEALIYAFRYLGDTWKLKKGKKALMRRVKNFIAAEMYEETLTSAELEAFIDMQAQRAGATRR